MKTSSEVCHRLSEGPVPDSGEGRHETTFSDGYAVAMVMSGRAASPGMAIGRAAVVMDIDDMVRIRDGAVIVPEPLRRSLRCLYLKRVQWPRSMGAKGPRPRGLREHMPFLR
jgi:hypothetical protein